ncbi:MAG: MFS transporter [Thermoleophilaceae bacterium]
MLDRNWTPERVRHNFQIDLIGGITGGIFIAVLVAFMPVVVRRMGGSPLDVALVVAAPFIGHLLSPVFAYLLTGFHPVRVVVASIALARAVFLVGMLVATTPLMFAMSTVAFWVIAIANVAAYTALMAGIYPQGERAQAMSRVRMGAAVAGIAAAALAGAFIDAVPAAWAFAAATVVSLPGALQFARIRYDGPAERALRRGAGTIARDIWGDRRFRLLLLSFSVFGFGNLMNLAVVPILLVDHFDAPNAFVGLFTALQSATMIVAFLFVGRRIDRGSSLRFTLYNTALVLLLPLGYLLAPTTWALLPIAVVGGIVLAGAEITYHTNVVQLAPVGRVLEYAAAQSFLLGVRGTAAPFAASALMAAIEPRAVLVVGLTFMLAGLAVMTRAVREPTAERVIEAAPA